MEEIISLLEEKVLFLDRFFAINEHEMINFSAGDFENIEAFYQAREKLLEVVREIDRQIETLQAAENADNVDEATRLKLEWLLNKKSQRVDMILAQDLQILALIEDEKSKIIRDLQNAAKTKKLLGAYKGDALTNQLDEKV